MVKAKISLIRELVDINRRRAIPLYEQIYEDLRKAIIEGKLAPGTRLPSSRSLTTALDVSRTTMTNTFDQLKSEGYLDSHVGSGTYVSRNLPPRHTQLRQPSEEANQTPDASPATVSPPPLSEQGDLAMKNSPSMVDHPIKQMVFNPGVPAYDAFPLDTWSTLASRRWRFLQPDELVYGHPAGYRPLREAVCDYLQDRRGVRCTADQVVITSGSQHAFTLVSQVLIDEGDEVFIEDPGYPQMRTAFEVGGGEIHTVPVDKEGADVSAIPDDVNPELIGVTPSHQYPLGTTMSLARREQLLDWSLRHDTWILEDDYDSGYRYSGRPITALQGMDRQGQVLYAGTFSKILFPALRLGYLVVPPRLVDAVTRMRDIIDRSPPRVPQMILLDFIQEGYLEEHIRKMRTLYSARQNVLVNAVEEHLGTTIDIRNSDAGLHLTGFLPRGLDDQVLCEHLLEHDVLTLPLSQHSKKELDRGGLLLGFAGVPEEKILSGVRRMAAALEPFRT